MKQEIAFYKMVGSGNDFIIIAQNDLPKNRLLRTLTLQLCNRKYGIGADGLLIVGPSRRADVRMRVFNADGSQADMCGNGARCVAAWVHAQPRFKKNDTLVIETRAGLIQARMQKDAVKIRLSEPHGMQLKIPIVVNSRPLTVSYINTGVPHVVVFVAGLSTIDVHTLGKAIREHVQFKPAGANVNFVEIVDHGFIKVRTFERGVEAETLACGTGSVASALLTVASAPLKAVDKISVLTQSGEVLKVYFKRTGKKFHDVWLEGKASIVYKGGIYV